MDFTEVWEHTCSAVGLAAREGHLTKLKKLVVQEGMPVDVADNRGWRPLHEAAAVGKDLRCLEELLKHGDSDVNWQTHEGETALLLACKRRKGDDALAAIKILLTNGADVNIVDNEQESALLTATRAGLVNIVKLLLSVNEIQPNIADYSNWTPLHDASSHGHLEIVQQLLKVGAKLDVKDECGITPIFTAAQKGQLECLNLLLTTAKERKMLHLINTGAEDYATPMLIAAQQGFIECVELLLSYGANPNIRTDDNATALHLAVQNKHADVLQLLLKHMNIDEIKECCILHPSQPRQKMINPLHLAVEYNSYECLKLLVDRLPVDSLLPRMHLPNEHYYALLLPRYETVLSLAVAKGDMTAIKILIDAGADCNYPLPCVMHPVTTLLLGDQNSFDVDAILQLLIQNGAVLNYQSRGPPTNSSIISSIWNPKLFFKILCYGAKPELCFQSELSIAVFVESLFKACDDQTNILNRVKIMLYFLDLRSAHLKDAVKQLALRSEATFGVEYNPVAWDALIAMCNNALPLLCVCRIRIQRILIATHKFAKPWDAIQQLSLPYPLHAFLNYSDLPNSI